MSGRASPFAALTGAEKQIKWLEVQSVRLPYVQGALEGEDTSRDDGRGAEIYADTYTEVRKERDALDGAGGNDTRHTQGTHERRAPQSASNQRAAQALPDTRAQQSAHERRAAQALSDPRTAQSAPSPRASQAPSPPEASLGKEARARQLSAARIDFQTTRHKQYDAVIARMRKAEQQARGYSPIT